MTKPEAKSLRGGDAVLWTGPVPPGPIQGVVKERSAWHVWITWADGVEQLALPEDLRGVERA